MPSLLARPTNTTPSFCHELYPPLASFTTLFTKENAATLHAQTDTTHTHTHTQVRQQHQQTTLFTTPVAAFFSQQYTLSRFPVESYEDAEEEENKNYTRKNTTL